METLPKSIKPFWYRLTKKSFKCPQCGQGLRVPIRPGKTLQVSCVRCPGQVLVDFRVPFIEVFKWQSGKSLKQNLVDFHHRFWNLPLQHKIHILIWLIIAAMLLDMLIGGTLSFLDNSSTGKPLLPVLEDTVRHI